MKNNKQRLLLTPIILVLLLSVFPAAADPAFPDSTCPAAFRLTGIVTSDKGAAFRLGTPDSDTRETLAEGTEFDVTGAYRQYYRILYEGRDGYVVRERVRLKAYERAALPAAAYNGAITLADVLPRRKDEGRITFDGSIKTAEPLHHITLFVWDERQLKVEKILLIPTDGAERIGAEVLNGLLPVDQLAAGRKTIVIQGTSDSGEKELARLFMAVRGRAEEIAHITDRCQVPSKRVLDNDVETAWQPSPGQPSLTVTLPEDASARLLTVEWLTPPEAFTITLTGPDGQILSEETRSTGFFMDAVPLTAAAYQAAITPVGAGGISTVRVYPETYAAHAVRQWEKSTEKTDLMLFATHQDDEYLFFGGMIPCYNARGKNVTVVYMTNCGRRRCREALDGLWTAGLKQYPEFIGWLDTSVESLDVALGIWKRRDTDPLREIVRLIREKKPEVVVTHDFEGEYGHIQHKLTAHLVTEASALAADPDYDPDSAASLGTWRAKKVYVHLYGDDPTLVDWSQPLAPGSVITPLFLAKEGFDKHRSQQGLFTVERYGELLYDCRAYGLFDTTVGADEMKNDLFENIP